VCSNQQESIPGNGKRYKQVKNTGGGGPNSYRLSQKNTGEDDISPPPVFVVVVVYILKKSFRLPYEGTPLSRCFQNIWLALA